MAITNADGSIILTTKVDTKGINNGINTIQGKAKSLTSTMSKLGGVLAGVFSVTALVNFSKEASNLAIEQEANVQRLTDIYGEASNAVGDFIDQNARALGMSQSAAAGFSAVYGNLFSVWADQATSAELTNRYLNMTAVVASKTGRTVEDVQERIRSGLLGNTEAIEDLGVFVNIKTIEITDAFQRIADGRSWEQLNAYEQQQVRTLAILEQSTKKYGDQVADTTALTRSQYQAAYQDMQATWGQFVNVVLVPVLNVVTKIMNIITAGMRAIAGLSGKTLEGTESVSSSIGSSVDNQNDLTEAVKGTNKELKKSLAGFDELNTLSQDTGSGAGGGGTSTVGGDLGIGDLGGAFGNRDYVSEIDATLTAIMGIAALALVAIGLILLFTGHIGWGIGFIIAGAGLLAVTMASASEFGYDGIINMLTTIMGIAGGALLALGIILLWIGGAAGKGVAIGMIIAGGALIVSSVAAKAAFSPDEVGGWLSLIIGIASGALLALGVILCMVGSVPLGVGMIIAGAIGLVSAVALNFDTVKNSITGWVAVIMAIAGAAFLVLGIILCVTGTALPLGIALIMAGAVALVTPIALNWNAITNAVTKFFQENAGIITGVSIALLVLGIILIITGVGIPLGIGLIIAGATGIVAVVSLNWNFIVDKVKEIWEKIKQFWNTYIAPVFTARWWEDLGKRALNGLIGIFEKGINYIISKINTFVRGIDSVISAVGNVFGADWSVAQIPKVSIPRLAKGAVIPPNREFMAVLGDQKHGTNIEAPLDTIVQAFNMALKNNGGGGFNGRIEIPLYLDSRQIALAVRDAENNLGSQTVFGGFANAY